MIDASSPERIRTAFTGKKILVIGDLMMDRYLWGKISRESPEAPVPVVEINEEQSRPGGAANVALNVAALGAIPMLCGCVGDDANGNELLTLLQTAGFDTSLVSVIPKRKTTSKTRVIGNNQHIVRVDREVTTELNATETNQVAEVLKKRMKEFDAVILEDYDKGFISASLVRSVVSAARQLQRPVIVDPKFRNFLSYPGVTLFKPNLKELNEAMKLDLSKTDHQGLEIAIGNLRAKMPHSHTVVTLGDGGAVWMDHEMNFHHQPARISIVRDVSGAGDTVVAVLGVALAGELPMETAVTLANLAGGMVVEQVGVVPVNLEQLIKEYTGE